MTYAPETIHYTASEEDAGTRVDRILAEHFPDFSRSQIQRAAEAGTLLVNDLPAKANQKLADGDSISLTLTRPESPDTPPQAEDLPLDVVFEDDHVMVINKAAGMVVHPAAGHRSGTLVNALLGRGSFDADHDGAPGNRPGIVHRLDKGTSGLMVVAKTELAHRLLSEQLKDRSLTRVYWAICWGKLKKSPWVIDQPVGRSNRDRKRMAVTERGRTAQTTVTIMERYTVADWVEAKLGSGRTHQIRVHLAHAGHPVVGDSEYGGTDDHLKGIDPRWRLLGRAMLKLVDRPALHARRIEFLHPTDQRTMEFEVPLPADLTALIELCREKPV